MVKDSNSCETFASIEVFKQCDGKAKVRLCLKIQKAFSLKVFFFLHFSKATLEYLKEF